MVSPFKPHTDKRINKPFQIVIVGTILVIIGAAIFSWLHITSTRKTALEQAAVKSKTQTTASPVQAAPKQQTPMLQYTSGTAGTLGIGVFLAGKDITPGMYEVTIGTNQRGELMIIGPTTNYQYVILDTTGSNSDRLAWMQITSDATRSN